MAPQQTQKSNAVLTIAIAYTQISIRLCLLVCSRGYKLIHPLIKYLEKKRNNNIKEDGL